MLEFDLFETLAGGRNLFAKLLLLVGLQSFALEFLVGSFNLALECAHFPVHDADRGDEPLASRFFQMQTANLLRDLKTRTREFATITQQLLRALAARNSLLVGKLFKLLQAALVEQLDVVQPLDRPLQILFAAILVLLGLHLIRECDDVANVEFSFGELVADPEEFDYGDWGTRDRFLRSLLTSFNSLGNGHFLFPSQQRHYAHLAHVDADRVGSFVHFAGREIQLDLFTTRFVRLGRRRRLFNQGLLDLCFATGSSFQRL